MNAVVFYRSLATMFESGVPLNRALEMLSGQLESPRMRDACADVLRRVESGVGLDLAMAAHTDCFGTLEVAMIRLGMRTGRLGVILTRVAYYQERAQRLTRQVWAALTYPLVTLALCLVMLVAAPPLVLSSMLPLLQNSGVELPFVTRALALFSRIILSPFAWILLPFALVSVRRGLRNLSARLGWWRFWMSRSGLGPLLTTLAVTRFARALVLAQEAGVSVQEAIPLATRASGNPVLQSETGFMVEDLLEGSTLAECLEETGFFPPLFLAAVVAGQETGRPGQTLGKLADIYEVELESRFETLSSLLAPAITVLLGGLVTVLNLALLLPMVKLLQKL